MEKNTIVAKLIDFKKLEERVLKCKRNGSYISRDKFIKLVNHSFLREAPQSKIFRNEEIIEEESEKVLFRLGFYKEDFSGGYTLYH